MQGPTPLFKQRLYMADAIIVLKTNALPHLFTIMTACYGINNLFTKQTFNLNIINERKIFKFPFSEFVLTSFIPDDSSHPCCAID